MSFPRYPDYKDSGVEWLGEVPGHWNVKRLKRNMRLLAEKTDRRDYPVALENIEGWTGRFIATETEFSGDGIAFEPDDILFGKLRPYLAKAYRAEFSGEAIGDFHVMRPFKGIDSRFAQYQILNREFIAIVDGSTFGSKMPRASWEFVGDMLVTTPPIPEQTQIAAFLDRETAKIDALVAEQRRLMALLKEKRQAVISHAVTQGLNPDAPMKPSGIEWLGDVPEHWDAPYLGVLIDTADLGGNYESSESGDGIPLIKMGNLDRGFIKTNKVESLPEEIEYSKSFILNHGDFLFNTRNSLDLVGKVAIWRNEIPLAIYNSNILRISFKKQKVGPTEYMSYFFNSDLGLSQLRLVAKGTTSVAAIYYKDLTTIRVLLPPIIVQHSIVDYLNDACAKLDTLTTEAQRAIDLLQERRTALFSAAVTGQIDVRGAV